MARLSIFDLKKCLLAFLSFNSVEKAKVLRVYFLFCSLHVNFVYFELPIVFQVFFHCSAMQQLFLFILFFGFEESQPGGGGFVVMGVGEGGEGACVGGLCLGVVWKG